MANKTINQFAETTVPGDNAELLIQESGTTKKSKLISLLKRVFSFDDVYDSHTITAFGFAAAGGNTQPTLKDFIGGLYQWAFDAGAQIQEGMFVINMNHTIKQGTDLDLTIHWSHTEATPSGDIKWNIDYTLARSDSVGIFAVPITLSSIQTADAQYAHHTAPDMTIPCTIELEPSSMIICRIWRDYNGDAEDTFNADAFFLGIDVHYVKSRVGTLEKDRPFLSGGFS